MHIKTRNFISNKLTPIKSNPEKLLGLLKRALYSLDELAWKKNYMPAREELERIIGDSKEEKPKTVKEEMREKAGLVNEKEMSCNGKMRSVGKKATTGSEKMMYSKGKGVLMNKCPNPNCSKMIKNGMAKCPYCRAKMNELVKEEHWCKYCSQMFVDENVKYKHELLCSLK